LNGTKHICLAITEPSGGSDVGNLKTTATRDGNHYIINGAKTFITGGLRANWFTTAVRTGGDGIDGISLILIPADAKGISRNSVGKKQGWLCSETASIYFDNVRVPADQIIGAENKGFKPIVHNFNNERIGMVAACLGASRVCLEEAAQWAQDRKTFGKSLSKHQVIQHKFAEMLRKINATQAYMDVCGWHIKNGTPDAADIAMLKVQASQTMEFCAREAMQIMGDWAKAEFQIAHKVLDQDFACRPAPSAGRYFLAAIDVIAFPKTETREEQAGQRLFAQTVLDKTAQMDFNILKGSTPAIKDPIASRLDACTQSRLPQLKHKENILYTPRFLMSESKLSQLRSLIAAFWKNPEITPEQFRHQLKAVF